MRNGRCTDVIVPNRELDGPPPAVLHCTVLSCVRSVLRCCWPRSTGLAHPVLGDRLENGAARAPVSKSCGSLLGIVERAQSYSCILVISLRSVLDTPPGSSPPAQWGVDNWAEKRVAHLMLILCVWRGETQFAKVS